MKGEVKKKAGKNGTSVFSFSGHMSDQQTMDWLQELAYKERMSRSELILKLIRAYVKDHYPGNPQIPLTFYTDGEGKHAKLSAAYSIKRIQDLIGRLSKAKPDVELGILLMLKDECMAGAKVYDRTGSQELGALVDECSRILKARGVI